MSMRTLFGWLLLSIASSAPVASGADDPRKSVFKIFSSQSPPNMFRPWEVTPAKDVSGSGVLIEGGRILTNAHVAKNSQQIYVQAFESSEKLEATVEFIAEDCDLATLKVDSADAIKNLKPVPLAEQLPALKAKVNVLGYPEGGDTLSVTEGVVSRIECTPFYFSPSLLRIQVDAAINPGNSGGPAMVNDQVAGIVFSKLKEGDNIGYLIPAEVVRHFLADCASDKKYDGFPSLDMDAATLENPALRGYLKVDAGTMGVVLHRVNGPNLSGLLKPWDVVMACDGVAIDNLGMVPVADGVRTSWHWLISRKTSGSPVKLSVFRDGKKIEVQVPTVTKRDTIIQRMAGDRPTYFIYGGLVFSPASIEIVYMGYSAWLPRVATSGRLLSRYIGAYREKPDQELVLTCCPILPHKITKGYDVTPLSVLTHVNDQKVGNLKHLITLIKANKEPYIVFRFEDDREEKIVLDPKLVKQFQPEILRNNNIPTACSDDLRDMWP